MTNKNLSVAKKTKQDEFYTQMSDIENELKHYSKHFAGKTILCNCDDPYESNFFKYFASKFNDFGLKKLISTCYNGSPISGNELGFEELNVSPRTAYKVEITEMKDYNGDGRIDLDDVRLLLSQDKKVVKTLKGNGDFSSTECVEFLKEADIVVTNPPFSIFRDYLELLMKYNKKFIIIGNKNAITYKQVFPLIKDNKMWIGATSMSKDLLFDAPEEDVEFVMRDRKKGSAYRIVDGVLKRRSQSVWFTNLEIPKRHEALILYKNYSPEEYPRYDNYDAINVRKVDDIPCDYDGVMGVPISFLEKYCPEQFEILGITKTWYGGAIKIYSKQKQIDKQGKETIVTKLNDGATLLHKSPPQNKTYYIVNNKYYTQLYARILIKKKNKALQKSKSESLKTKYHGHKTASDYNSRINGKLRRQRRTRSARLRRKTRHTPTISTRIRLQRKETQRRDTHSEKQFPSERDVLGNTRCRQSRSL